jgi:RNA-directed DNA polymerase
MRISAATSISVPHAELMRWVARRIVDGAMLHLIKMRLEAPVEETDEHGNQRRSVRNRDEGRGTPQGAPISPLLSNLYMCRFVLGWKELGYEAGWEAHIVNSADDLVICCRTGAKQALDTMQKMMSKLSVGESVSLLREPDAGDPPIRFDQRDVKTEHGLDNEEPADERAGYR